MSQAMGRSERTTVSIWPDDSRPGKPIVEEKPREISLLCNPVNDYLAPHWERSLRTLVEGGFLRIVKGDAAAGAFLVNHPEVGHTST